MLSRFFNVFKPSVSDPKEQFKFFILALCSFFMMGAQWPLKILKDALLLSELGVDNQPIMRVVSVLTCFFVSVFYGQLVNVFRRETVVYLVVAFLTILGIVFYSLLSMYQLNILPFAGTYVIQAFYLYADIFTALILPTFWAFVNDVSTPDEATRNYGYLVFAAQFGGLVTIIIGRILSTSSACSPNISLMSTFLLLVFAFLIFILVKFVKKESLDGYVPTNNKSIEKHNIPFLKGLGLILASPYVSGILFLTIAPEVLTSIVNFQWMKVVHTSFIGDKQGMLSFFFNYAVMVQIVSSSFSLVGGYFFSKLGVKKMVVLYPFCFLACVLMIKFYPSLLIFTSGFALIRGIHYGLNKPARESLYIPTTKEVRYKSKAWIDVFGTRIFKATGASICRLPSFFPDGFLFMLPIAWVFIASFVGIRYDKSIEEKETVV